MMPIWFYKIIFVAITLGTILAGFWALYFIYEKFMKNQWLKYPENKPKSKGLYWITLRGSFRVGHPLTGVSFITSNSVFLASYNPDDDKFYWGGFDGMDINKSDDGDILAFMPHEKEPAPYGGKNKAVLEVPPDPYGRGS